MTMSSKTIPAYLVVISLIRGVQIILATVLFWKVWTLSVQYQFEVFCRTNSAGLVSYEASFPFAWLTINSPSDCAEQSPSTTTYIWTGMGPTVYVYIILTVFEITYAVAAIAFYLCRFEQYDLQKKLPAIDLLISLVNGLVWLGDAYLAWHNLPGLKETSDPDKVISSTSVCSVSGGYCSPGLSGDFKDMSSYLFLALANALSCGIAVWFIFMETGLAPDDYEDEVYFDFNDSGHRVTGLPALVAPFSSYSIDEKGEAASGTQYSYNTEYGMSGNKLTPLNVSAAASAPEFDAPLTKGDMMQQYLNAWKDTAMHSDLDDNLFPALMKPPSAYGHVKTVSNKELERDIIGDKVHAKWNLFKA